MYITLYLESGTFRSNNGGYYEWVWMNVCAAYYLISFANYRH